MDERIELTDSEVLINSMGTLFAVESRFGLCGAGPTLEGWSEPALTLMLRRGIGPTGTQTLTVWEWTRMVALALLISSILTIPLTV